MWLRLSTTPLVSGTYPCTGNQPKVSEKNKNSRIPRKKSGIETPSMATVMTA
jgi:hypothetical protein